MEHKKTLDQNDPKDFIDLFLKEQIQQGSDSTFTGMFADAVHS